VRDSEKPTLVEAGIDKEMIGTDACAWCVAAMRRAVWRHRTNWKRYSKPAPTWQGAVADATVSEPQPSPGKGETPTRSARFANVATARHRGARITPNPPSDPACDCRKA